MQIVNAIWPSASLDSQLIRFWNGVIFSLTPQGVTWKSSLKIGNQPSALSNQPKPTKKRRKEGFDKTVTALSNCTLAFVCNKTDEIPGWGGGTGLAILRIESHKPFRILIRGDGYGSRARCHSKANGVDSCSNLKP